MVRNAALVLTLLSVGLCFLANAAKSPGLLGFALLMVILCATVTLFSFASDRIDQSSKSQVYVPTPEEMQVIRRRAEKQRTDSVGAAAPAPKAASPRLSGSTTPTNDGDDSTEP